jgi:hypothetical protein
MKALSVLFFTMFLSSILWAQDIRHEVVKRDSTSGFFESGHFHFHSRTYLMGTYNRDELSDYGAWAAGAGLGYVSPEWKHFSFGFSGFFIFKLWEHNLNTKDPLTGGTNRYEVALFDMEDPENSTDLDRLEELFIKYRRGSWSFIAGRQHIETPFLNGQDNRMRPNIFSGLWTEWEVENVKWEAGWLNSVSPRGTVDWFGLEESLGVYSFGKNVDGSASQYKGNSRTAGVFILGGHYERPSWKFHTYHYYTENIFHLSYGDALYKYKRGKESEWFIGTQWLYQQQVQEGGQPDPQKSYIQEGEYTWGSGATIGSRQGRHRLSYNMLYLHDSGRFVFPREWGREKFWASLPRERFEGAGGLFAQSIKWEGEWLGESLHSMVGSGWVIRPDPQDAALNKYGQPSFYHIVAQVDYDFSFPLAGLKFSGLLVYKGNAEGQPIPDLIALNRVDLWHYSVIIDYLF